MTASPHIVVIGLGYVGLPLAVGDESPIEKN
jgi:UDP-N-acetyl-D-mannosaminuronate dehydrogenase